MLFRIQQNGHCIRYQAGPRMMELDDALGATQGVLHASSSKYSTQHLEETKMAAAAIVVLSFSQ
jgi:hypothetical protein